MFFLCNFCPKHFLFWQELSVIWSKMYVGFQVKCRLFVSDMNETWVLLINFWMLKYQISWKLIQCEPVVECRQTDGHTDMTKLIVALHNFANVPKICRLNYYVVAFLHFIQHDGQVCSPSVITFKFCVSCFLSSCYLLVGQRGWNVLFWKFP